MSKPIFTNLLKQQIAVMKAISFSSAAFIALLLLLFYYVFGMPQFLPTIMLSYVTIILLNILALPYHNKAYLTFYVLIIATHLELMAIACVTDGIYSPIIFILIMMPSFAFYTSYKQGKIWFVISLLSIILLYNADSFGIQVSNIVSDKFRAHFELITILFALTLYSMYQLLVKQDAIKAHKRYNDNVLDLEEKTKRLENEEMLVNYAIELMCVIDIQTLTFVEVNPAFRILLGYELFELKEQPIRKIFADDSLPIFSLAAENKTLFLDNEIRCKNQQLKAFRWLATARNGKLYAYGRII
ncbi:MAG: PAS domain-containing protein [Bacteroidia bacterium]